MSSVLKTEPGAEACCVCGAAGVELCLPAEYDADAPPLQPPLRHMLLHLNNNKVVPDGRLCPNCIRRTLDAYNFSTALASKGPPPLSEKIRALRQRLHELTQKIDVFIVVGGGAGVGGAYNEQDIIMVERGALQDVPPEPRGPDARGAPVYQCSVCPLTFTRMCEYRVHCGTHPGECVHTCWSCGARCSTLAELQQHKHQHVPAHSLHCHLCDTTFQSSGEERRHESTCPSVCPMPGCAREFPSRALLRTHAASHGELCAECLLVCESREARAAHALHHRRDKHFVCGYHGCILRFHTRSNLLAHIRKCHGGSPPAPAAAPAAEEGPPAPAPPAPVTPCPHCPRMFGSQAAMKRHARTHFNKNSSAQGMEWTEGERIEYLEVETLEELE